jgi:hypothetical protein
MYCVTGSLIPTRTAPRYGIGSSSGVKAKLVINCKVFSNNSRKFSLTTTAIKCVRGEFEVRMRVATTVSRVVEKRTCSEIKYAARRGKAEYSRNKNFSYPRDQ